MKICKSVLCWMCSDSLWTSSFLWYCTCTCTHAILMYMYTNVQWGVQNLGRFERHASPYYTMVLSTSCTLFTNICVKLTWHHTFSKFLGGGGIPGHLPSLWNPGYTDIHVHVHQAIKIYMYTCNTHVHVLLTNIHVHMQY